MVVILPEPDRGAIWDTVLRDGGGRRVPASRTPRCQTHGRLAGVGHFQEVRQQQDNFIYIVPITTKIQLNAVYKR